MTTENKEKYSLLLVDDEEHLLSSLRRLGRYAEWEIITSSSPREAIDLLKKKKVDNRKM